MIETKRLILRKFVPEDARDLFDYLSLPETYIFEPGTPISLQEAEEIAVQRAAGDSFWAVGLRS